MCIEIAHNRMTIKEARTALKELILTANSEEELSHYQELAKLSDVDVKEKAQESLKSNS